MRKILLSAYVFFLTPVLLILTLLFYSYINSQNASSFLTFQRAPKVAYAALPGSNTAYVLKMNSKDGRIEAVKAFLDRYNSSLSPYAEFVVSTADKYGLDYRLIPAIAMQESTLCKKAPKNSYNCWGFGIYGKKVTRFDNYHIAIETVTKTLATKYKDQGLETPEQIMSKYTPSSNGSWAKGVLGFMERMEI
ncbi:MAG: hypothetical protein A3B38_01285 [Candidatus Levybacteria bacterium RIFCSPLOWO2_01_FULL_36_13]|nr:MAG: hypothetical protein A2684_02520 [Candidatus Levybacteria bacterium RIFCSPHIGHO2_01_FULL_36_15b]OGH35517.1 MAG: hypothetical protein A3B38_01285 [Candidatus Levybacteria bacterium RIFCSPLOWO2_01_FULL_36_13]